VDSQQTGTVRFRRIVLQKSKVAGLRIFAKIPNREAIADSYSLNRAAEFPVSLTCRDEAHHIFIRNPRRLPLEFFSIKCETTFATQSGVKQTPQFRGVPKAT
jgi:hypothetical protein